MGKMALRYELLPSRYQPQLPGLVRGSGRSVRERCHTSNPRNFDGNDRFSAAEYHKHARRVVKVKNYESVPERIDAGFRYICKGI
jgi:hypothetical protein